MDDVTLPRGANRALPDDARRLRAVISWTEGDEEVDVDASALLLAADRRVRSDEDFIFYNQPTSAEGSVCHAGRARTESTFEERLTLDLDDVPRDVETIVVAASLGDGTFGQLSGLRLVVLDGANVPVVTCDVSDATTETAFVFAEVYRRQDAWKIRAVGQGWDSGLAGLAQDFGVSVDDEAAAVDRGDAENWHEQAVVEAVAMVSTTSEDDSATGAEADDLVDVTDAEDGDEPTEEPVVPAPASAETAAAPAQVADDPAPPAGRPEKPVTRGVRTRKAKPVLPSPPALRLAEDPGWQPARLFSIFGVGSAVEQEKRATSAVLAVMMGVRPFARGILGQVGAPGGAVETYIEVPFEFGETRVQPDGVLRVARAGQTWTGLLEVKTGDGQLRKDQVENYLDVARTRGFDAVITISNEIPPGSGEHPVVVDKRKLRKVALFHLSWAEVLHEAQMTLTHRGVADAQQAWLLYELIRYLQHPRSGASGFEDMGSAWVPVREAVSAGTLRVGDRKVPAVAESWIRLVRHLRLRLTAELGVGVSHVLPRKVATDPVARVAATTARLVASGELEATLRVPGAAGPVTVVADLRTSQVRTSVRVQAPQEGGGQRRVTWLLRQLKDAPDDVLVDVSFSGRSGSTCERLGDVREKPAALLPERGVDVALFTVMRTTSMGTKRSGIKNAFIPSVTDALESFYKAVVEPLRAWVPPAPKLPDDVPSAGDERAAEGSEAEDVE